MEQLNPTEFIYKNFVLNAELDTGPKIIAGLSGYYYYAAWMAMWHAYCYLEGTLEAHRKIEGSATLRICYPGLKQKGNKLVK